MYEFKYHRPETVRQAANLLIKNEDAKVIAGGHTLLPVMKRWSSLRRTAAPIPVALMAVSSCVNDGRPPGPPLQVKPPRRCYWLKTSLRKRAIATLYSRSARSSAGLLGLVKAWVVPL